MTTNEIDTQELATAQAQTSALIQSLPADVTTVAQYDVAASRLRDIKQRSREIDDLRKSMTRPLDEAKTRIMELFRPLVDDLAAAETALKRRMVAYQEAEDRRVAAERRHAELERAQAEAEATRAVEAGEYEDALRIQEERDAIVDPEPNYRARDRTTGYKPAAGTSTTTRWSAEVRDLPALILAVAMGEAPLSLLRADQSALDALARATKAESTVPGVRFVSRRVLGATGRR